MYKRSLSLLLILCILTPLYALASGSYRELEAGSKGDAVRVLQTRLIALHLLDGKSDGDYGEKTVAAVQEAQMLLRAAGYDIADTGVATTETQILLFDPGAEEALTTLRIGCKGENVRTLQSRLIDLKLLNGVSDGSFGPATESAVRAFQEKLLALGVTDLSVDGVADSVTQELITQDLSVYNFAAPIYFNTSVPLSLTEEYLYAKSCILLDAPSGETLFEYGADDRRYPASTTKIMTLLLALEYGHLNEIVTIPDCAADIPSDSSRVPVYPGEQMHLIDLLYGLILRSGNDAANAIAFICAGSVEAFVARMNEKAAQLGMSNTHFMNPHGYHHESHYTTARDLAQLTRTCLTDAQYCQVVTCLNYTMSATSKREALTLVNPYEILDAASEFYIPGAAGVKSGYTNSAGFCYVGAAQRDGQTLIAVILGVPTRNRAWTDMRKLFEYGFAKLNQ